VGALGGVGTGTEGTVGTGTGGRGGAVTVGTGTTVGTAVGTGGSCARTVLAMQMASTAAAMIPSVALSIRVSG
jgi:hypothetical protein